MTVFYRHPTWYFKFYFKGQRHGPEGGHKTKRAAMDAEADARREIGALRYQQGEPASLSAAAARYRAEALAGKPSAARARHTLALFLEWAGEGRAVSGVTPGDVEGFRAWRRGRSRRRGAGGILKAGSVRGTTVNRDLADLSAFFAWCLRAGLSAGQNPCLAAAVPRDPDEWAGWIVPSPAQQRALWRRLPRRERAKATLLKHLGVRRGIVLGLRWEQVDLASGLLTYHSKGKTRVVPVNATALAILRALKPQPSGSVFPERSITGFRRAWDRARRAVGLPRLRVHDLRVAFARELASAGVDLATIQDLLGHSTIAMARRYVPESLRQMRRAVRTLDRMGGLRRGAGG